jgi:hypothetical protein
LNRGFKYCSPLSPLSSLLFHCIFIHDQAILLNFVRARSTSLELAVLVLENEPVQAALEHFEPSQLRLRGEQAQAATSH